MSLFVYCACLGYLSIFHTLYIHIRPLESWDGPLIDVRRHHHQTDRRGRH